MDLKEIMSVSGQRGLFKFVSQGRNGIIVESFSDSKRSFVSASNKVSSLEDIAIFTAEEEVPLKKVFGIIFELTNGGTAPDSKASPDELKSFMEKVLPNYDKERVYISDIKKLVTWYNTLLSMNMVTAWEQTPAETEQAATADPVAESASTEDPAPAKKKAKAPAPRKTPSNK